MTETTTPATPAPEATPAPAEAVAGEEQALLDLYAREPQVFEYRKDWGGKNQTGAERLVEIRNARATNDKATQQQAEPAPSDDDGLEIEGIDLDAPAGDAEGEDDEEPELAEERTPLKAWAPPEGQEVNEQVKPALEALDAIAADEKQRDGIIDIYSKLVEAQTTRLAELNKAEKSQTIASLKSELGDGFTAYRAQVDAAFAALPQQTRDELKGARLADGRLLLTTRAGVEILHRLGAKATSSWQPQQGSKAAMREELRQLNDLMSRDIDEYRCPNYRGLGVSASERRLQIMRQMDDPDPNPAATAAALKREEEELVALRKRDPQMFSLGSWRGGRSAAERLSEIRSGRA